MEEILAERAGNMAAQILKRGRLPGTDFEEIRAECYVQLAAAMIKGVLRPAEPAGAVDVEDRLHAALGRKSVNPSWARGACWWVAGRHSRRVVPDDFFERVWGNVLERTVAELLKQRGYRRRREKGDKRSWVPPPSQLDPPSEFE